MIVYSCTFCEIPGELVEVENLVKKRVKNKVNSGTTLAKKPKTFVRYVEGDSYKIRDEVETLRKMLDASKSNGQQSIDGVKGKIDSIFYHNFVFEQCILTNIHQIFN